MQKKLHHECMHVVTNTPIINMTAPADMLETPGIISQAYVQIVCDKGIMKV